MGNKIKNKCFRKISQYSGMMFVVLVALIIFPLTRLDDNTQATITPSTTTLTLSTSDISAEITPNNANGTFVASDPATVSVTTNNYSGYTLGITSSDDVNNTKLINTDDNTAYLTSISSASSADNFNANNWGYLPSKLNSQANTNYQPAPTTTATTLEATNAANTNANEYTITLGAKADYTLPSGTYENTFTLTAVANPVAYSITYNKNTEDTVENMPSNQSGNIENADITIPNTTPTRENYTFRGWCNVATTTSNNTDSCSGTTYQPGDVVNMNKTTTNVTTLYAMWKMDAFTINFNANNGTGTMPAQTFYGNSTTLNTNTFTRSGYVFAGWNTVAGGTGTSYSNGGTFTLPTSGTSITLYAQWSNKIQDVTADTCPTTATIFYDNRDNTAYHIQKLADGRCWMLDNLALDLTNSTVKSNLNASNTNASATTLNYLKNGGGSTTDKYATAGVVNWTNSYSYSAPLVNMDSKNVMPTDIPTNGNGNNKVGGYYNLCAASAGSYCYGNGTNYSAGYGNVVEDICPAGWRMPTGGASTISEFQTLFSSVTGSTSTSTQDASQVNAVRNALSIPLSGYYYDGTINSRNSSSVFESSIKSSDYMAYSLNVDTTGNGTKRISTSSSYNRSVGWAIRCITKQSGVTISFNSNGGSGNMPNQTLGDSVGVLSSNTFTKTNYVFTGWNTKSDGTGISYTESHYYGPSTTLYAQWTRSLQGYTKSECSSQAASNSISLADSRDGQKYTVRYINGNCWVLGGMRVKKGTTLTSADSNVANSYIIPDTDLTAGDSYTDGRSNGSTSSNAYYYNYCAATAGTVCNSTSTTNATYSICPKGWHLPTKDEFNTVNSDNLLNVIHGYTWGYFTGGSLTGAGSGPGSIGGFGYWTSSAASNTNQYARQMVIRVQYNQIMSDSNASVTKTTGYPVTCIRSN